MMRWYQVRLCAHCASGGEIAHCYSTDCARYRHALSSGALDCRPRYMLPLSDDQVRALEAGRDFERGLV